MSLSLYRQADSFPYRLNPITKIVSLLMVFQIAMTLQHPAYLGGLFFLLLAGMLAWGILLRVWRGVWILMGILFLLTTLLWMVFMARGSGGFPSAIGFRFGAGMGLRLDLMLMAGVVFLTTTRVEAFTWALTRLGVPYRAGFALTLAFRLVPVFLENALTVADAQKCRGWQVDRGGPIRRARRYVPLLVPIFISSLRSADHLSMALESKGFGTPRPVGRRGPRLGRFGWPDWACLVFLAGLDILVIILRIGGYGTVI